MTIFEKNEILNEMKSVLTPEQMDTLSTKLTNMVEALKETSTNDELLKLFETAKKVEGCSMKSMKYYMYILNTFLERFQNRARILRPMILEII